MKKLALLFVLLVSVSGCGSQTDSATASKTSQIDTGSNRLKSWLETMQQDAALLSKLNTIGSKTNDIPPLKAHCKDADVLAAMNGTDYRTLIDDVDAAIEILRDIPNHGTTYRASHLPEIESLAAQTKAAHQNDVLFTWQSGDLEQLEKNLKPIGFSADDANATSDLIALLKGDSCQKILPRYCEFVETQTASRAEVLRTDAALQASLVCDLTQWAGELRLNYPANDYKFDRFRAYVSDETITAVRKRVFIEDIEKNGIQRAFDKIQPPDPQYQALKNVRKIYETAIANGGWPTVETPKKFDDPKIGKSYGYVIALKARLKAEGYPITDEGSDVFDESLAHAIALYRDVHQLNQKRLVDKVLFRNIAVGPEARLETIDLAMQKYRESAIGSLNYYVKVNVPDYYVEVWRNGKREARHRIVVGNNKMQLDPITQQPVPDPETLYPIHPNRTPLQTSKINEIILNPYWNVPARIRIEELEPKLAENPNYYIENNYEEVNKDDPRLYYVRELPNPKNSLGKVKFMFPNPHNTYLHDTPVKAVFKNPGRALSHGCMRVQDPMDLAELLLKNDGQWNEKKVKEILDAEQPEQVSIELNHPVDVDVVYINARVDDSGVAAFLSDIYEYDAVRTGKVVLKRLPKPKDWK